MEFKDRLREARTKAGKTQREVANMCGTNEASYRRYELGSRTPTCEYIALIADALDVSADWLLGLSSDPQIHSRIPLEQETEK